MDIRIVHNQIEELLETLQEQHVCIKENNYTIYQIDIDLFLSNIRKLYDSALLINKLNKNTSPAFDAELPDNINPVIETATEPRVPVFHKIETKTETETVVHASQPVQKFAAEPETENNPVCSPEAEKAETNEESIETIRQAASSEELETQPEKNPVLSHQEKKIKKTEEKTGDLFGASHTIADQYEETVTLHDKIAEKHEDKSLADKLKKKPIKDLKAAIGINEKFLFINELFDGNLQEYNNSIDYLNKCTDFNEADTYLKNILAEKHKWDMKSKHVADFTSLIERRFMQ